MDEGSKSNMMKQHLEEYNIESDYVAPANHRANGTAEQTKEEVNVRMNVVGAHEWMKWHKYLKKVEISIRTKPA